MSLVLESLVCCELLAMDCESLQDPESESEDVPLEVILPLGDALPDEGFCDRQPLEDMLSDSQLPESELLADSDSLMDENDLLDP